MNYNFINIKRFSAKRIFLLTFLPFLGAQLSAQVLVDFEPRTSQQAPAPYKGVKNYNLQGDFNLIGNTNLTLENYNESSNNSNSMMVYVDVDDDLNTVNSSSALLEIGNCAEVVYAGLYWSGRSTTSTSNSFTVNHTVPGAAIPEATYNVVKNNPITPFTFGQYGLTTSYSNSQSRVVYTLSGSAGSTVEFRYRRTGGNNNNRVQVRIGSGSWQSISSTETSSNNILTATLDTPYLIELGFTKIEVTKLQRQDANNDSNAVLTYKVYGNETVNSTKTLYKNQVQFKHESDSYQTVQNLSGNVIYTDAGSGQEYMWAGYADVTDYVRSQGAGNYFAADLALMEGNGGNVGYYGSWGLVVVYKDITMPWRDITVFDGYAFIKAITTGVDRNFDLPVDGFRAVQTGDVNVKLGLMAGEGDTAITGDYFSIKRRNEDEFDKLLHPGTTSVNNFFNGSIQNGGGPGSRNPYLKNNTGADILMFNLPNQNKRYITNNDTSTTFRYGTTQDTYIIYSIVFAVDAYVPEIIGNNQPNSSGTPPSGGTIEPGTELDFGLDILNFGNDSSTNTKLHVNIPYFMHYVEHAQIMTGYPTFNNAGQTITWIPPVGAPSNANPADTPGGTLEWYVGDVPAGDPNHPDKIFGRMEYKLKVSGECKFFLTNECLVPGSDGIIMGSDGVDGGVTGTGVNSGIDMNTPFTRGLIEGGCPGYVFEPISYNIDVNDIECPSGSENDPIVNDGIAHFISDQETMPRANIADNYPEGTRFFDAEPTLANMDDQAWIDAHEILGDFPAPAVEGAENALLYYAITPGMPYDCHLLLDIERNMLVCFKDPNTSGPGNNTRVGVTLLQRAGSGHNNWPMVRKGGFIALESNTQGFVITRMEDPATSITNPKEGMMVYDMTEKCLKIYTDGEWLCYDKPGCED